MGKLKVPHTFPVPPMNKGTLNSLKIMEPSSERSAEQGTFGGSLSSSIVEYIRWIGIDITSLPELSVTPTTDSRSVQIRGGILINTVHAIFNPSTTRGKICSLNWIFIQSLIFLGHNLLINVTAIIFANWNWLHNEFKLLKLAFNISLDVAG